MAYKLVITTQASFDAADASFYYETMQQGLSHRFLSELINTYHKLIENPQHYSFLSAKKKSKLRDINIKGFPYRVIFDINDQTVTVYAVFHTSRKPKYK